MARLPNELNTKAEWQFGLTWRFALAAVANRVTTVIGRTSVIALGGFLERCFAVANELLRRDQAPQAAFENGMLELLLRGAHAPGVEPLLDLLAEMEVDPACKAGIESASSDWLPAILAALGKAASKGRVSDVLVHEDGMSRAEADLLVELVNQPQAREMLARLSSPRAKADALNLLAMDSRERGDLASAAVHLRGAVELDPERPELHQDLGGTLGRIGRVEEGLKECQRALELRPGWPIPLVQIGIILLDAGRNDEALRHVEDVVGRVPWTPTLGHLLGIAQMRAHRFADAILSFERVLDADPLHALALDSAAHCYLMLQNWSRGRELAKQARSLGQDETWAALEAGNYQRRAGEEKKLVDAKRNRP